MRLLSQVAIKSIRKERITDDLDRIHIQREIEITASLRHANIIRFQEGEFATTVQMGLCYFESSALTIMTFWILNFYWGGILQKMGDHDIQSHNLWQTHTAQ